VFQQVMQEFSLVPRLNREPTLIDRGHRETLLGGDDLLRALHVAAGELLNLRADGCTDEDRLRALLHGTEDLANVLAETNVEHAIHFVQDHHLELVVRQQAALVHVHHSAGRSDNDLWVALQRLCLGAHRLAAIDRNSLNSSVSAEFLNFAADLDCQFAGRHQDQRAELVAGLKEPQDWQAERRGLAGTGLGLANDILAAHGNRNQGRLNLGWVLEPGCIDALQDGRGKAEVCKCLGRVERLAANHPLGRFFSIEVRAEPGLGELMAGVFMVLCPVSRS